MKKIIYNIGAALLLFSGACSDNFEPFDTNSSVESSEDSRISYFDIDPLLIFIESTDNIGYANLKSGFFNLTTHEVEFRRNDGNLRCGIYIRESSTFPDGDYLLTFSDHDHQPIDGMLKVTVKNEHIVEIGEAKSSFSLRQGSGTEEDPYIIGSPRDFLTMLNDLRDNELTNGRGIYFKQTADITLMDQSSTKPGRGYFGYSFAGHYDGGGHSLREMYYRGAEDAEADTRVGIFPTLLDGADVSHLCLSGVNISNTYSDTGALAGVSVGYVSVSDIELRGSIFSTKASNIGGLIGRFQSGTAVFKDIRMEMSISARDNVGGLIGKADGGSLTIEKVTTPNTHFSVEGVKNVGGIIGSATGGEVTIKSIQLSHVVSKEDADIRTIRNLGGEATGGIAGSLTGKDTKVTISDVEVNCPVGGQDRIGQKVGGVVGNVHCGADFSIGEIRVTSIVSGETQVGGYVGRMQLYNNAKLIISGDSKTNYILPDDSAASIKALDTGGGVFGYYEGSDINSGGRKIRVGINVDIKEDKAGGVIGQLYNANVNVAMFNMTSSTMQVTGRKNVGGFIGSAEKGSITGESAFDYSMNGDKAIIPDNKDFTPLYIGIVKGNGNVGGIVGHCDDIDITALVAGGSVIGLGEGNIGGIAGVIITRGATNVVMDNVSLCMITASSDRNVGGICGYVLCDYHSAIQDCINYGSISGGNATGGIVGYYEKTFAGTDTYHFKAATIEWCVNQGEVKGADCVGGVIGKCISVQNSALNKDISQVYIAKCGNNGPVSSEKTTQAASGVGGIVGYGGPMMKLQYNSNNAKIYSAASHKGIGGIAGSLGQDADDSAKNFLMNVELYKCINTGVIDSSDPASKVGGLLGFMEEGPDSHLNNCLNTGEVLNKHNSDNGGILGYVDHFGKIYDCVNTGKINNGNGTIGTHKPGSLFDHDGLYMIDGTGATWPSATVIKKEDICNESKYSRLDFKSTWIMTDNGPEPRNCPF